MASMPFNQILVAYHLLFKFMVYDIHIFLVFSCFQHKLPDLDNHATLYSPLLTLVLVWRYFRYSINSNVNCQTWTIYVNVRK
jgi:hypothetical protein